jgi:hypothetical protein
MFETRGGHKQCSAPNSCQQAVIGTTWDDRACNSGGLTTPDLASLYPCWLILTSGLQFVPIVLRVPSMSTGHTETLGDRDCLAMKPTSLRRRSRPASSVSPGLWLTDNRDIFQTPPKIHAEKVGPLY